MKRFILLFVFFLSVASAFAQIDKRFFGGIQLGVTTQKEAIDIMQKMGIQCMSGSVGNFGGIEFSGNIEMGGATFSSCKMDFFRGRFWGISFQYIKTDPDVLAQRLEDKFARYSISDSRYEYRANGIELLFDGTSLRYLSISVNNSIANSIVY